MAWFKIYAGLGGGFGGPVYQGIYEYGSAEEALKDAYRLAEEEYQSYEGCHGILSYEDCEQDLRNSGFIDDDLTDAEIEDIVADHYLEVMESWISYEVKEAIGPDDKDD